MRGKTYIACLLPFLIIWLAVNLRDARIYPQEGISLLIVIPWFIICFFLIFRITWINWDPVYLFLEKLWGATGSTRLRVDVKMFRILLWFFYSLFFSLFTSMLVASYFGTSVPEWMSFWVVLG